MITNTGKVLIPTKTVKTAEENTEVDVKGLTVPAGYKLEKVTIDGKEVKAADNYKVEIGKDTTSIVYVVEQIPSAKPIVKPEQKHESGNTENKPAVDHNNQNKPSTDKNDSKSAVKPDGNHKAGNTDNKPAVDHNDQNKPSTDKNDSKSAVKPDGNHKAGNTDNKPAVDHNNQNKPSTDKNDSKPAVKPDENHKAGNTDNKPAVDHNNQDKPSTDKNDSKPVVKPQEQGEVIIKVIDQNGKTIEEATHTGVVGLKFNPITIPSKDKLVNVTVNGKTISENDVKNEIVSNQNTGNKTTIIYNVEVPEHETQKTKPVIDGKVIIKVVDQNGKVIENAEHEGGIGSKFNPIQIPKDDKVISVTVNGNKVNKVPDVIEENSNNNITTIIYNVNVPENNTNDNQGSSVNSNDKTHVNSTINNGKNNSTNTHNNNVKPVENHNENNHSEDKKNINEDGNVKIEIITNEGKVLLDNNYNEPVGSKINNVDIPNGYKLQSVSATVNGNKVQEVPTKVEKGETTIIYNVISDKPVVNHNEGNTDKHSDVKPAVNHNEGNTDKHSDVKPAVNHNEDNTNKHSDIKPVVNHNEDNTNEHSDSKSVVNHNGNSKSTIKEDGGKTIIKQGLPDTGVKNTEDGLGILAGIMAAIAALRIFRRKK